MTFRYCPYFCEENLWHLCSDEQVTIPVPERSAVILSNGARRVFMQHQRAGEGEALLWDYHAVLLAGGKIWDLDTTLGCPIDVDPWVQKSFLPRRAGFEPQFRVVDAPTYLSTFASDRSHMLDPRGVPLKPFPSWPRIGQGMNLMRFVDMEKPFVGEVLDLESFRSRFGPH